MRVPLPAAMITMSKFIRFFKLLSLIIAASALLGCSAIKLAYNQAPELAYWWMDGYVDFNDAQSLKVRSELTALQAWHRQQELPKLAEFLNRQATLMTGEVSAGEACIGFAQARVFVQALMNQPLAGATEIALSITPEQIKNLNKKYAQLNAEYERDYRKTSASLRQTKRFKQAVERSERLYGKLEEPQLAAVELSIKSSSFDPAVSLKERVRRQQEFTQLLNSWQSQKPSLPQAQAALGGYLQRSMQSDNPAYRSYSDRLIQEGCTSFASFHASATPAQRERAASTLRGWATDALILAAQK
jgi:hypothetical protein